MDSLERKIQKRLSELDLNLFLDKEAGPYGLIYSVKFSAQVGEWPSTVLTWTDPVGRPLPLSDELIIAVRLQEGDIREAISQIKVNNALKRESARQERNETMEEISKEFEKSAKRLHMSGPWAPKHDVTAWSNKKH